MAEQLALEWPAVPDGAGPDATARTAPGPPAPGPPAPDQADRDRVAEDLMTTLFVDAGAGSGKTSALVGRVVALVGSGVPLHAVVAITFTDKAATELRDRLRQALEVRADEDGGDRFRDALDDLDGAAIGTLHSFAQRLLSENPVEAGLPPSVEVLDEVSSGVEFDRRWAVFRDELLADPDLERTLLLLTAAGVRPDALRVMALAFDANWDLVAERVPASAPEPPAVRPLVEPLLPALRRVVADAGQCRVGEDQLRARLEQVRELLARLEAATDEVDEMEALVDAPSFLVSRTGRRPNWACDIDEVRARVGQVGASLEAVRSTVTTACAERVASSLRRFTLAAADERRAAGRLEFHDLLVLARSLLRHPVRGAELRARLHARYQRILLDEFQDTDPIQIELAVRIAAADPAAPAAGSAPWSEVEVGPGRLFVVGDPKQSIYRFRRADISTFLAARTRFGAEGLVELTANFRTASPIIEWVNVVFASLMAEAADVDVPVPSQAPYTPLRPVRPAPAEGAAVSVLGRVPHPMGTSADELRAAEAGSVAAAVTTVMAEGWLVEREGEWSQARLGDITVLVPARTSLPFLEDALDAAGVPFRAESSSLVYASRVVRDLLMVVRAVDDPTDHLRTIAALRTPLLGCGDDDLFRYRVQLGGSWSYQSDQTVPPDDPVAAGLAYLGRLHDRCRWLAPSELLTQIAADRRAFELGFAEGRPRDVWRRLRFVIDQARAWSEAVGGGLRDYLHWVEQQSAEGVRVAEAVLPETDDDAVRIMTIHAAKGLEFPITIVSGMSTAPREVRGGAQVVFPPGGEVGYSFAKGVRTEEFEAWRPIDEQMGLDERVRLLYVACTRARDHLIVSLHRKERRGRPAPRSRTNAELMMDGMGLLVDVVPDLDGTATPEGAGPPDLPPPPAPLQPLAEWALEREAALARARRPMTVAATALSEEGDPAEAGVEAPAAEEVRAGPESRAAAAEEVRAGAESHAAADEEVRAGLEKRPRDLDLPPWMKGRYGTAVGRAVHGALQSVDLATGAGLDAAVAAQCEAEAVVDRLAVRRLVEVALQAPSVQAAAGTAHWREVYTCVPAGGDRLLEGYVDLLYRVPEGLVVVDYKTSARSDPAELARRVAGYRAQGASYALAIAASTGEPVVRVVFVFLTPSGAIERPMDDLDEAVEEVGRRLREGLEVIVGEPAETS